MSKAQEWRERALKSAHRETVELELPSGMKIRARRPNPMQFAAWGRLPLTLLAATKPGGGDSQISDEDGAELVRFMRDVLTYSCVEPRVSLDPHGDEEIHPRDIPQEDWIFIIRWALRVEEGRNLEGFRREPANAAAGGDSEDVRGQAVPITRDQRPGSGSEF